MKDLFNHKIDVKSNKTVDITKTPSNAFRGMQVKPVAVKDVETVLSTEAVIVTGPVGVPEIEAEVVVAPAIVIEDEVVEVVEAVETEVVVEEVAENKAPVKRTRKPKVVKEDA